MSAEEKDAQIGRLVREKKQAEQELSHLTERAREYGGHLSAIGHWLKETPQQIAFSGISTDVRHRAQFMVQSSHIPSFEELKALVLAIQQQQQAIWNASAALKNLGM